MIVPRGIAASGHVCVGQRFRRRAGGRDLSHATATRRSPAIARLEGQLSQLMSVVMELKRKEPGDAVAGDASRGGGAAVPSQREALPPGGGGAFSREMARDGRNHPRESSWDNIPGASPGVPARVTTGWASRSGANPVGPAGMSPGVGPDRGEARGLNPQGEQTAIRGAGAFFDGYSSSCLLYTSPSPRDRG